ncbi:protein ORF59 [Lake sturgeon herpesvirus]|nr:protein ORF59 [Lake sturgeon herpesvirus]
MSGLVILDYKRLLDHVLVGFDYDFSQPRLWERLSRFDLMVTEQGIYNSRSDRPDAYNPQVHQDFISQQPNAAKTHRPLCRHRWITEIVKAVFNTRETLAALATLKNLVNPPAAAPSLCPLQKAVLSHIYTNLLQHTPSCVLDLLLDNYVIDPVKKLSDLCWHTLCQNYLGHHQELYIQLTNFMHKTAVFTVKEKQILDECRLTGIHQPQRKTNGVYGKKKITLPYSNVVYHTLEDSVSETTKSNMCLFKVNSTLYFESSVSRWLWAIIAWGKRVKQARYRHLDPALDSFWALHLSWMDAPNSHFFKR